MTHTKQDILELRAELLRKSVNLGEEKELEEGSDEEE